MNSSATLRAVQKNVAVLTTKRNFFAGSSQHQEDGGGGGGSRSGGGGYQRLGQSLAAAATAAAIVTAVNDRVYVHAKEEETNQANGNQQILADNRIRQFKPPDQIFNYFASYMLASKGRREMMMTPLEFYSSITPDCSRQVGAGAGKHVEINEKDIKANQIKVVQSPVDNSVLNKIGKCGLLTYSDYGVLLALLSTPRRYIDTAFNIFDVTGSGTIGAKEFAFVSTKMALKLGGFGSYTDLDQEEILASSSGLLNYLFGVDRKKEVTKEQFKKLQTDLLGEIIKLEFMEYDKSDSGKISEADFVKFLLKNGKITPKRKAMLIKRVEAKWPSKGRGVSLKSFKNFFYVLAAGVEIERALFFLDVEMIGVDKDEFRKISSWVCGLETSDHIVEVLFTLLDEDEDGRLQREEMGPVLLDWRQARGYDKMSIGVRLGEIRI